MGRLDEVLVVSLGTGSKTDPIRSSEARGWGRLEWAQPILDVVFDGVADTVDFQAQQLLPDGSYHRFQIELPRGIALDDARPATIAELRALGDAARARALGGPRRASSRRSPTTEPAPPRAAPTAPRRRRGTVADVRDARRAVLRASARGDSVAVDHPRRKGITCVSTCAGRRRR